LLVMPFCCLRPAVILQVGLVRQPVDASSPTAQRPRAVLEPQFAPPNRTRAHVASSRRSEGGGTIMFAARQNTSRHAKRKAADRPSEAQAGVVLVPRVQDEHKSTATQRHRLQNVSGSRCCSRGRNTRSRAKSTPNTAITMAVPCISGNMIPTTATPAIRATRDVTKTTFQRNDGRSRAAESMAINEGYSHVLKSV
jgi:hypothetical protein